MRAFVLSVCALAATAATTVHAAGQFTTVGSTIYDPNGNVFIAHGVNVPGYNNWDAHDPTNDVSKIADAWGFNLIRANSLPLTSPIAGAGINLDNMIKAFTTDRIAAGKAPVVVMVEAHESTNSYFTDQQLTDVTAWYRDLATKYKNNPYVWFNVGNEPGNLQKPANWPTDQYWDIFQPDKAKWETMHQTVIKAIRDDVGSRNMIVADGTTSGQDGAWDDMGTLNPAHSAILSYGKDLINFNNKTYSNILFDTHIYGMWSSPGSTPQRLEQYIKAAQAQGLPLIFGEYNAKDGDSTSKIVSDLLSLSNKYGIGRAAWSWSDFYDNADLTTGFDPTVPGWGPWWTGGGYLINDDKNPTNLTAFGQQVWNDNHTKALSPGDANGDGKVDADDFALMDRGLAMGLAGWTNGDFNADGTVNAADFLLADEVKAQLEGTLSTAFLAEREAEFGSAYVSALVAGASSTAAGLTAGVPEPSVVGVVAPCAAYAGCRRRRA